MPYRHFFQYLFFFNDTATTEIYTLSLHDALPISADRAAEPERMRRHRGRAEAGVDVGPRLIREGCDGAQLRPAVGDRKSTRLNSSHSSISYAVFCLKKKNDHPTLRPRR